MSEAHRGRPAGQLAASFSTIADGKTGFSVWYTYASSERTEVLVAPGLAGQ